MNKLKFLIALYLFAPIEIASASDCKDLFVRVEAILEDQEADGGRDVNRASVLMKILSEKSCSLNDQARYVRLKSQLRFEGRLLDLHDRIERSLPENTDAVFTEIAALLHSLGKEAAENHDLPLDIREYYAARFELLELSARAILDSGKGSNNSAVREALHKALTMKPNSSKQSYLGWVCGAIATVTAVVLGKIALTFHDKYRKANDENIKLKQQNSDLRQQFGLNPGHLLGFPPIYGGSGGVGENLVVSPRNPQAGTYVECYVPPTLDDSLEAVGEETILEDTERHAGKKGSKVTRGRKPKKKSDTESSSWEEGSSSDSEESSFEETARRCHRSLHREKGQLEKGNRRWGAGKTKGRK